MKIGTDAMVLGAFAEATKNDSLLDIGAGTGVLSLMLNQKEKLKKITVIELDADACIDLEENLNQSPFETPFTIFQQDFTAWNTTEKFDTIISNPPFYKKTFTAQQTESRWLARNEENLPFEILIKKVAKLLSENGQFWFIIPIQYAEEIILLAKDERLNLKQRINIFGKPNQPTRTILAWTKKTENKPIEKSFTIRNEDGKYTDEYIELTREFHATNLKNNR